MRRSNFALRVPPTLLAEARKAAESYVKERARRADPAKVSRILARVGRGNPPIDGDELPLEFAVRKVKKKK